MLYRLRLLILAALISFSGVIGSEVDSISRDSSWEIGVESDLSATVIDFSDEWEKKNSGSFNWMLKTGITVEKKMSDWSENRFTLNVSFGQTRVYLDTGWTEFRKSSDLIELEDIVRFTHDFFMDTYVAINLESQFIDDRDSSYRYFFNPWKGRVSAGISAVPLETDKMKFTIRIGAAERYSGGRNTYAGDSGIRDSGLESVTDFSAALSDSFFLYNGRLSLFQTLIQSGVDPDFLESGKKPDIKMENDLRARFGKFMRAGVEVNLIYDRNLSADLQYKQIYTLGISYSFNI